ncbi:hypothetical protein ACLKA6_018593 [Drosophila palustris]
MFSSKSTAISSNSLAEEHEQEDEEAQEEEQEEETELNVKQIAEELQEMTLYLDEIDRKLQSGVPSCPRRESCDGVLELYGSRNTTVRKLQSNAYKLQHQMEKLFDCSKTAKSSMIDLHHSFCHLEKQIIEAHYQTNAIESIKLQMDLDGVRCQQRYQYLRDVYFNWTEAFEGAREMKRIFKGRVKQMYSKAEYHKEKRRIFEELEEMESTCVCAQDELMQQAKHLKCWVNVLIESEPLWNSMVSLIAFKPIMIEHEEGTKLNEHDEKLRMKRSSLSEIRSSVSFSTGRYDHMLSMIKQKSVLSKRL